MNLEDLPPAVEAFRHAVVRFTPLRIAMHEILEQFDVTEAAVRARFEQAYGITPEELAARHAEDRTIEGYIEHFRRSHERYHSSRTAYLGKRFYMVGTDKRTGRDIKRWYRFLISHGLEIIIVDEVTKQQSSVLDGETLDDIALQVGWKRWSHWPDQGPQPSRLFPPDVPT